MALAAEVFSALLPHRTRFKAGLMSSGLYFEDEIAVSDTEKNTELEKLTVNRLNQRNNTQSYMTEPESQRKNDMPDITFRDQTIGEKSQNLKTH